MIEKVARGLRRHWLRLLVGGFLLWAALWVFWVGMFVYLESQHIRYDDYDLAQVVYVTLVLAWPLGALWAWMRR